MKFVISQLIFWRIYQRLKKKKTFSWKEAEIFEPNLNCDINLVEYINCKNQLEEIYDDIAKALK